MKKSISFLTILLAVILFLLAACSPTCNEHADSDKDGKCDICGAVVEAICTSHPDTDKDGKCDICGAIVEAICTSHSDTDKNGKCDRCGIDVELPCTEHIDANNDETCDNCGEDVPFEDDESGESGGIGDGKLPPNIDLPLDPFV